LGVVGFGVGFLVGFGVAVDVGVGFGVGGSVSCGVGGIVTIGVGLGVNGSNVTTVQVAVGAGFVGSGSKILFQVALASSKIRIVITASTILTIQYNLIFLFIFV
jgi:hypothetical protein